MFLSQETDSTELFLSPLTQATCCLLETRSSHLIFSVILLLYLLLLLALPPPLSPLKGENRCQICGSPCESVDLPAVLLFTLSVTAGVHICVSIRIQTVEASAGNAKRLLFAFSLTHVLVGFFLCVFLSSYRVKRVKDKEVFFFIPSAAHEPKITQQA